MLTHKAKRRKIFYRMNETGASDKIMVGSFFRVDGYFGVAHISRCPWLTGCRYCPALCLSNPCHLFIQPVSPFASKFNAMLSEVLFRKLGNWTVPDVKKNALVIHFQSITAKNLYFVICEFI